MLVPLKRLAPILVLLALAAVQLPAAQARAAQNPCYAEVWYTDQTRGHTYEYRCGPFRLHAGQIVRVPRSNDGRPEMATARVVRVNAHRTYFGALKTVAGIR